jgi:alkylation response protein AidB-like acyl-CoA dehydrogenase
VDLALSDEQRQLIASFTNLLGKASPLETVRASEATGFDHELWRTLLDTGAVTMAVAEEDGGWGASLLDLALVAEQVGRALAPAPVIEAQVAARLLAADGSPRAVESLEGVLTGQRLVTIAPQPARDRIAALVPAGSICDEVIVSTADRVLLAVVDGSARVPIANLAAAPLADIELRDVVELANGPAAIARFENALDEWLVLTAAAVVGIGAAAHEIGCGYACERQAFGAPIGTFQGVAHPLADDAMNLDGARLLTQKAAWSLDCGERRGPELAAMAFAFASRTAATATYNALHVQGGYGFMLESDVQLHYRRARGWPRVWGDADAGYRRAASARYGTRDGR